MLDDLRPKLLETDGRIQSLTQELTTERIQYENLEAEYKGSSEETQIILANLTLERDQLNDTVKEMQVCILQVSIIIYVLLHYSTSLLMC